MLWRDPFVLSAAGLAIIALGILYAKNRDKIEGAVVRAIPTGIRRLLPMEREARTSAFELVSNSAISSC